MSAAPGLLEDGGDSVLYDTCDVCVWPREVSPDAARAWVPRAAWALAAPEVPSGSCSTSAWEVPCLKR